MSRSSPGRSVRAVLLPLALAAAGCALLARIDEHERGEADAGMDTGVADVGTPVPADAGPALDAAAEARDAADADRPDAAVDVIVDDPILVRQRDVTKVAVKVDFGAHAGAGSYELDVMGLPDGVTLDRDAGPGATSLTLRAPTAPQGATPVTVIARRDRQVLGQASVTLLVGGAPGTLDRSFADNGVLLRRVNGSKDTAVGVVVADGGRLLVGVSSPVVAGLDRSAFAMLRVHPDGGVDEIFSTRVGTADAVEAKGMARLPDGKILVVGGGAAFVAVRFLADGDRDTAYGTGGVVAHTIPGTETGAFALAVSASPSATILGGFYGTAAQLKGEALASLRDDASLEAGFGTDGIESRQATADDDIVTAVAQYPELDSLLFAGVNVRANTSEIESSVRRYLPNGNLDTRFAVGGSAPFARGSAIGALIAQNKTILVTGSANGAFRVTRLNEAGGRDSSFNGVGTRDALLGGELETGVPTAMALDKSGRIVVAGWGSRGSRHDGALVRLTKSGAMDIFGSSGAVSGRVELTDAELRAVAVQPDGRIVVAGFAERTSPPGKSVLVLRYWP